MREKTYTVYFIEELTEEAQETAIDEVRDINVNHEWWDFVYEDAKEVGVAITSFDACMNYVKGYFLVSAKEVAENIINNHGEGCETYKSAQDYMIEIKENGLSEEADNEFKQDLCEVYRFILRTTFDYLISDSAIKETIIANEYEFTKEGKLD